MTIEDILKKTGQTEVAVLREHFIMKGLAKLSQYEAQCMFFEKKYTESFESFQARMQEEGKEDFKKEDDLMDWEYANAALRWWKSQIEDLKSAA